MRIDPVPFGTAFCTDRQATSGLPQSSDPQSCPRCLRDQPPTAFRVVNAHSGRRASHCNTCHALAERHRRNGRHKADNNRRLYHAWGMMARAADRRRSIENLTLELLGHFGSASGLARAWHQAFAEASGARRLRAVAALIELLRWTEANPETFEQLTDEELASALQQLQSNVR